MWAKLTHRRRSRAERGRAVNLGIMSASVSKVTFVTVLEPGTSRVHRPHASDKSSLSANWSYTTRAMRVGSPGG